MNWPVSIVVCLTMTASIVADDSQSNRAKKPAPKAKKQASRPQPEQAKPKWIWVNECDKPAKKVYFRKEIDARGVAAARLYAVCDDRMTIFVDGEKILEHGNWQKPIFADISKQLDLESPKKKHVIAVEGVNSKSAAGLLIKLDLESGWRDAWSIVSDHTWQASTAATKGWKRVGFNPKQAWKKPDIIAELGGGSWAKKITAAALAATAPLRQPTATPINKLKVAKGFQVELLYSVPKAKQGSWVNMCVDPKGRLIVSDQYGSLYRVTVAAKGKAPTIEKINVDIGEAQGLLWAFNSLYVSVNRGKKYDGGLYRVRDTDGDDQLDTVETLRKLQGSGEHGPHAVLPHPDGKSLVIICGNRTALTEIDTTRVPLGWDEDLLLPRVQGRFMRGTRAPGGYICRIDPDGKNWELIASGFRNEFDGAFNADGELFTYDADMEWDFNLPWYRPTRICHVVSGAEFGWRSGGGKWPVFYADSLPPVVNVGPGSPTGVTFGYGAKFPAKYQKALFACDWSYGKLYAVHLDPTGSTYNGALEEFVTGTPLPLTDVVINPHDGAMYFLIGGRRVQSGLYRVTYNGNESTAPADCRDSKNRELRETRRQLESLHVRSAKPDSESKSGADRKTIETAWPHLGHKDRFIRYAARVAIENTSSKSWFNGVLHEDDPQILLTALMALARRFERQEKGKASDIDTRVPIWNGQHTNEPRERSKQRRQILEALSRLQWHDLSHQQKLDVLRVLTLTFTRIGPPDHEELQELRTRVDYVFPTKSHELNSELAQLMVYLQVPSAAHKIVGLLKDAPTQEQQIDYARTLRHLKVGWTMALRKEYFQWFTRATTYRGGASFATFVQNIRKEAVATLSDEEKQELKPILEAKPKADTAAFSAKPRPFVKEWKMQELVPLVQNGLKKRDFDNGRQLFGAAACFACHRFDNQGGAVGPDLTLLSGRFSARDLLESIVEPSKQISDQYGSVQIVTQDGKVVIGRIINLAGDSFRVQTNMLDPSALVSVDRKQIEEMSPSKISMMPKGLLNTLKEEEILDLMAYLLSRGDRNHAMFK